MRDISRPHFRQTIMNTRLIKYLLDRAGCIGNRIGGQSMRIAWEKGPADSFVRVIRFPLEIETAKKSI